MPVKGMVGHYVTAHHTLFFQDLLKKKGVASARASGISDGAK